MQYTYKFTMGRLGVLLMIYRINQSAILEYMWTCNINSFVVAVERGNIDGHSIKLCDHESFNYPDDIQEEEISLALMLAGSEVSEDREIIRLCSLLSAKWAAGHTEESLDEAIRQTIGGLYRNKGQHPIDV